MIIEGDVLKDESKEERALMGMSNWVAARVHGFV